MPHELNDPYRSKFARARYRVTNWAEYDRGLVQRGDVRFWISHDVLRERAAPLCKTHGGQRQFFNTAIEAILTLGAVYRLALWQTEGFVRSLFELLGAVAKFPDHTKLSRRRRTVQIDMNVSAHLKPVDIVLDSTGLKFYGAGEWARRKHGETRRSWRKLHISVDAATSEIVAHGLTDDDTSDAAMAGPLVRASGGNIRRVFADGAYDGAPTAEAIRSARPSRSPPKFVIPPRKSSIPPPGSAHDGSERERHATEIAAHGRMAWQKSNDYGLRSLAETGVGRVKDFNGRRVAARTFGAQKREIAVQIAALNRMIRTDKPITVWAQ